MDTTLLFYSSAILTGVSFLFMMLISVGSTVSSDDDAALGFFIGGLVSGILGLIVCLVYHLQYNA